MKLKKALGVSGVNPSPPARGRGLKQGIELDNLGNVEVAPCAGAWIETNGVP